MADECKREKKGHDRAKKATERARERASNKFREAARHWAEAGRERASMGTCVDIHGLPLPGCFADHAARADYADDQADEAFNDALGYLDEWADAMEEEQEREDEYCDCLNRQRTG